MKKILLLLSLCSLTISNWGQCLPESVTVLTGGNVETKIYTSQLMWTNIETHTSAHEFPIGSGTHVFYSGGLWIGGFDDNNELHFAGAKHGIGQDFFSGPLSTDGTMTPTNCEYYDQFFEVTRIQAYIHRLYFDALQQGTEDELFPNGYVIPEEFYLYPGQGNEELNEAQILAPYYDYNQDGNYNPDDGDYPKFDVANEFNPTSSDCDILKGDVVKFWINNDSGIHTQSTGTPLGIEIHNQVFSFINSNETLAENSTFYKKKIINRSSNNYHDVYIGIFADVEIGNPTDDYIGCNTERNLGYGYNSFNNDLSTNFVQGYGLNPPAAGIVILKGPLSNPDDTDNDGDGIVDNEMLPMTNFIGFNSIGLGMSDPIIANQYYNYMKSIWKDETPLTWGGNGHDNNSAFETNFLYPDDLIIKGENQWTEISEQSPAGDRRFLISMGPFDLAAGESFCIEFATVIGQMTENASAIEALYDNSSFLIDQYSNDYGNLVLSNDDMDSYLSIEENIQNEDVILWNSTNKTLSIYPYSPTKKHYLSITSTLGQTVVQEDFQGNLIKHFNVKSPGVYVVSIYDNEGNIKTKKITLE